MCFWKSKQSKVLRAKRDIVVYKIGSNWNRVYNSIVTSVNS